MLVTKNCVELETYNNNIVSDLDGVSSSLDKEPEKY
jgi:hypothetical protein